MVASRLLPQKWKKLLIILHDLVATALAVTGAFAVRFEDAALLERLRQLPILLPFFVALAGLVYAYFGLYKSKWRFASLPDLSNIFRASTVLAFVLLVADYILLGQNLYGFFYFGKVTIALYWLLQMFVLGGPRLAYRYLKYAQSQQTIASGDAAAALLVGSGVEIEILLRAVEAGTVRQVRPVGILSPSHGDLGQAIRGVPVLGDVEALERTVADFSDRGIVIRRLIASPSALLPDAHPETLMMHARRLSLPLSRLTSLGEDVRDAEIAPLEIEDLLLRPTVTIDRSRLAGFMRGKCVLVTGGGGSIGSELCRRAMAFGAHKIVVLENSEPSLHGILEALSAQDSSISVEGILADIRDPERLKEVFTRAKPDVVFHAAALKHVPYLEQDWTEAIKTNVFGSLNVAEATIAAGAKALVMISTDKAIEPVSVLGATKRLAEMIAQIRDAEGLAGGAPTRLIAVRFGNVLGSAGSVVPKFKAQIARGGPVTLTHPDMVRYFMTPREAADLVLTAASYANDETHPGLEGHRASVFVLKMGQPVRIIEMAERMIRLAGFEPGREIAIEITGVRPGERLNEILFAKEEPRTETGIDGVMAAQPVFVDRNRLDAWLARLRDAIRTGNRSDADAVFAQAIPAFKAGHSPPASMPQDLPAFAPAPSIRAREAGQAAR